MTETPRPRPPQTLEEVNTTLPTFDGARMEWWGFSVSHGRCVWKVTGVPKGVGYIFMVGTYYINFPPVMLNVRLRIATLSETEALRSQLPSDWGKRLREQEYRIIECQEGTFSVWSKGFFVVWGEQEASQLLREM